MEIYRNPQGGEYRQILKPQWTQTVTAQALPDIELNLNNLL
ncbi:hypothetical protein [Candidatus Venteria ishoeyi]|nr:hypothetical protein [Candidatus Venteria ishoeyi]